jgi:hypothetical protein
VYTPDGHRITHYRVITRTVIDLRGTFSMNFQEAYLGVIIPQFHAGTKPAARLVLQKFPKESVIAYLKQNRDKIKQNLAKQDTDDYWRTRESEFQKLTKQSMPDLPKITITLEDQIRADRTAGMVVAVGSVIMPAMSRHNLKNTSGLTQAERIARSIQHRAMLTLLRPGDNNNGGIPFLQLIGGRNVDKLKLLNTVVDTVKGGAAQ